VHLRKSALTSTLAALTGNWGIPVNHIALSKKPPKLVMDNNHKVIKRNCPILQKMEFRIRQKCDKEAERVIILRRRIIFVEFICRTGIAEDDS
jgi:hypothetical protein